MQIELSVTTLVTELFGAVEINQHDQALSNDGFFRSEFYWCTSKRTKTLKGAQHTHCNYWNNHLFVSKFFLSYVMRLIVGAHFVF